MKKVPGPTDRFTSENPAASGRGRPDWSELDCAVEASFGLTVARAKATDQPPSLAGRQGAASPSAQWTGRLAPRVPAAPSVARTPLSAPQPPARTGLAPPEGFERFQGNGANAKVATQVRDAQESLARWAQAQTAPVPATSAPALKAEESLRPCAQAQAERAQEVRLREATARALLQEAAARAQQVSGLPEAGARLVVFRLQGIRYAVPAARVRAMGKLQASHWLRGRVTGELSFGLGGARVVDLKKRLGFEGLPGSSYLLIETRSRQTGQLELEAWAIDGVEPAPLLFEPARWREPTLGARRLGVRRQLPGNVPISLL